MVFIATIELLKIFYSKLMWWMVIMVIRFMVAWKLEAVHTTSYLVQGRRGVITFQCWLLTTEHHNNVAHQPVFWASKYKFPISYLCRRCWWLWWWCCRGPWWSRCVTVSDVRPGPGQLQPQSGRAGTDSISQWEPGARGLSTGHSVTPSCHTNYQCHTL